MKTIIYSQFIFLLLINSGFAQYSGNYAGSFNGFSSYVSVPNTSNLSPTGAITIEAWVNPTQLGPNTMAVAGKNYQTGYFLGIQVSGRIVFYPKGNNSLRSRVSGIIPVNKWTHIAATYNNSLTSIYINGILDTSSSAITGALTVNTDSLFLGADRVTTQVPNLYFKGRLENVRIWGNARTSSQISENKTSPLEIYSPSGAYSNLRASFQLDNNALNYGGGSLEIGNPRNVSFINYSNKAVNNLDYNNSLVVNGTTDYFTVCNVSAFNATGAITLEAWIRRDTTGAQPSAQNIVNKSGGSTRYDYALFLYPSGELYFDINSGNYSVHTIPIITNSQWTHVAATYNSAANPPYAIIYINGQYVTSSIFAGSPQIQNNPDNLYIGGIGASSYAANKFKGQIDEVRIWKVERTSEQISDNIYEDATDGNLVDFSFDKNANAVHNGVSTIFAGNTFAGNAQISSSFANITGKLSSPVLSGDLTGFNSGFTNSYKRFYIPDNNSAGINDSVFISSAGGIQSLKAYVLISHTYTADLNITLTSPGGTTVTLINARGGSGNDVMTIFSDAADSVTSLGTEFNGPGINAPFSPSVKPQQQFAGFNGQNQQGWWKLKCVDNAGADFGYVHGWGISTVSGPLVKTLKLTSLIQGFYDSGADKMRKDTATVFLRNADPPYLTLDSARSVLDSIGKGNFVFTNLPPAVFFIELKHRNSIETWSSAGYIFSTDTLYYNFTLAASQAFESNQIQVDSSPDKFAVYSGDINQDGFVDLTDVTNAFNSANSFATGYVNTDVTGNNITDLTDVIITFNNSGNFVKVIRP